MIKPNFIILYVDSPETSARFYAELLGRAPVEQSPTFALFALDSGFMLGLWSRHTVEPRVAEVGVAGEVAFSVEDNAIVDSTCQAWVARGLGVLQTPTEMDFGYTFVALDPDGHRLRVFAPSGN
ncbi:VOC family protein [Pseudomonas gingeri]|uniref:VOC family protein n=1 Tax=Pseudomonas gingeri TaxID=117681 RepID=A0A7Y7YK89_9PSED|nr:VOC family protein [Pseudomonas gingeri]NVZ28531.1 VOC family protein [Pseudomonas gingeri]NWA08960.1 VOC family protein [Pseudomonas gingeri]NWB28570.1 VOC family protein [Pseudomonas gingeri]NWC37349.1 VOC family protein [Pseudomonas gingeri]NWE48568.1 VOC family protein [Pseudomonas gingeri]